MFDLFHLGQKVVYVAPFKHSDVDEWGNTLPTDGQVYTIRAFVEEDPRVDVAIGILLEEIVNEPRPCAPDGALVVERAFNTKLFRPVDEQEAWNKVKAKAPV